MTGVIMFIRAFADSLKERSQNLKSWTDSLEDSVNAERMIVVSIMMEELATCIMAAAKKTLLA